MRNNVLVYLINRIVFWIGSFLKDYFIGGGKYFLHFYQLILFRLNKATGLSANWRYFKVPLWREYSIPAYLLSIPVRTIKITGGLIFVVIVSLMFAIGEIIYFVFPIYLLSKIL